MSSVASPQMIPVAMGEIGVCRSEGTLRTLLGSCVGIALTDRHLRISGLAHIVMPDSLGRHADNPGKFADTAVPELIRRMQLLVGSQKLNLSAKIAGGANMFSQSSVSSVSNISSQNVEAVERVLKRLGIPVIARHCGGVAGRRMAVNVPNGAVTIDLIGSDTVYL